jgi:molybdopterin converting factor small subunit
LPQENISATEVLEAVEREANLKPGTLTFQNTLVSVNSVEVSALDGPRTRLGPNDTVLVIPVFHGGNL